MPSKSTIYYRNNPEAKKKKDAYNTKYNADPSNVKARTKQNRLRREKGRMGKGGKDVAHTRNGKSTFLQSKSKNRANNRPKVKQTRKPKSR